MKPYPLDWTEQTIHVKDFGVRTAHVVRKPSVDELVARSKMLSYSSEDVSQRESKTDFDDSKANLRLYDAIIQRVSGYDFGDGLDGKELRTLSEEQKAQLFSDHKKAVIRGLYNTTCERDALARDTISMAGPTMRLRQEIGGKYEPDFQIWHTLRLPDEAQRIRYDQRYLQRLIVKGSRKNQTMVTFNLRAAIEMYDALFESLEGATVNDQPFTPERKQEFLAALDPVFKEVVVNELMREAQSDLSD